MDYKVHEVEWTDEKILRFWNFQTKFEPFENLWFTSALGNGVIRFVHSIVKIKGKALDFGTGKGHLIKQLLKIKNCEVTGFDFSPESVATVNSRNQNIPAYKGTFLFQNKNTITPFPSDEFDFVFLIETIEHLAENHFDSTFSELFRILKTGGVIIVTTPNNENLDLLIANCPDCGCVFHRFQHMQNFTPSGLENLMAKFKFKTIFCGTTDFSFYENHSPRTLLKRFIGLFKKKGQMPHLVYIGKK